MKISIITVNLNNRKGLQKTIESVITQTYSNVEFIIIDGGSDDGSKEIIKRYQQHLHYSISEKDSGIYAGMNKGIARATGDYCLFLNSGDWLYDKETLSKAVKSLDFSKTDICYGDVMRIDPDTGEMKRSETPSELSFDFFVSATIPHQATFIKTSLFSEIGKYDENFLIISDWSFFVLALCKSGKTYSYIDQIISYFMLDGIGSTGQNWQLMKSEQSIFLNEHFSMFYCDYKEFNSLKNLRIVKGWFAFKKTIWYAMINKLKNK